MADYKTRKIQLPKQVNGQSSVNSAGEIIFAEPVVLLTKEAEFFSLEDSFPTPTNRIPDIKKTITSGTIEQAKSIAIANLGPNEGLIQGVSVPPGVYAWSATGNDYLDTLIYDATNTTFIITLVGGTLTE